MYKVIINKCYGGFNLSQAALNYLGDHSALNHYDVYSIPRHHPTLVKCVEELGRDANGLYSDLRICTVTDKYRIESYDGYESIITLDTEYNWLDPTIY